MAGTKILILLLPLFYLDGVHLKKAPQAGKPWIPPAHSRSLPDDADDMTSYVSSLFQTPDAVKYPPVQAIPPAHSDKKLRGFRCPQPDGYFKYTHKCDEYVNCTNNIPIPSACPPGLYFNSNLKGSQFPCDYPYNVQCDDSPTPYEITPAPTTTPPSPQPDEVDFNCPGPYGYYRHPDCDRYVECKNYLPIAFTCPAGLYFNPRSSWLDYPCDQQSRIHCNKAKHRPPSTTPARRQERKYLTTPRPAPRPRGFRCPQPHGYFRHADKCGSYVECKNFVPMTYTCPPGLHFNPNVPWTEYPCDQPWRAQCEAEGLTAKPKTTTTTTTTTPEPTTEPPPRVTLRYENPNTEYECHEQNGYFEHSGQCDKYIECKNYMPLRYTCPVGLHFNPRSQWTDYPCAHPSEVQCKRRPEITKAPTTTTTTTPASTTTLAPTSPAPKYRDPEDDEEYECKEPYGYFQHSECDEYIECKNYIPRTYACPAGLYFNIDAQWTQYPCDHRSRVQCNNYK